MADCEICGQPLGFFRRPHRKCQEQFEKVCNSIEQACTQFIAIQNDNMQLTDGLRLIFENRLQGSELAPTAVRTVQLAGFAAATRHALSDHELSDLELRRIDQIASALSLEIDDIRDSGVHDDLAKALTIKDLRAGVVKSRFSVEGYLPIAMKPDEHLLWNFQGVTRSEMKTSVHYEGGSHGVSVRVMKGVSYRVGASKGRRVEQDQLKSLGNGSLLVTSLGLQFLSNSGNKTIKLSAVSTVDRFSDGIGVTPSRGKTQFFTDIEPIFSSDLILSAAAAS